MVEINKSERVVRTKIIYYGPAAGGKTTNLLELARRADAKRRGQMISINTTQERTLLLDLVALEMPAFNNYEMRFQIIAVPGQKMYAASRQFLLSGADSVVFVANSAEDRWEETLESMREMNEHLLALGFDPTSIPVVFQYNKQDLPDVTPFEAMERTLNARRSKSFSAVASTGQGVLETFASVLTLTLEDLNVRFNLGNKEEAGQSIEQWAEKTMQIVFGLKSGAQDAEEPEDESDLESVTADADAQPEAEAVKAESPPPPSESVPEVVDANPEEEELGRMAIHVRGSGAPAPQAETSSEPAESLVESYVEAAAQLSDALEELREQHEATKLRLEELNAPIDAAQSLLSGAPAEEVLGKVLERIGKGLSSDLGSLSLVRPDGTLNPVVTRNIEADPIYDLKDDEEKPVADSLMAQEEPVIFRRGESGPLGAALEKVGSDFASIVAIPVRTHARALGLACFYLPQEAAAPKPSSLPHLARLGQGLALALEIASVNIASERLQTVQKAALFGHLAEQAISEIGAPIDGLLKSVGTTLAQIPEGSGAQPRLVSDLLNISTDLVKAQELREGVMGFLSGRLPEKGVTNVEDVLQRVKTEFQELLRRTGIELKVEWQPETSLVLADEFLLRSSLLALIENFRNYLAGSDGGEICVTAGPFNGDRVRIAVSDNTAAVRAAAGRGAIPDYLAWSLDRRVRGFGLTLAQQVVEHFKGEWQMSVDNETGNQIALTLQSWNEQEDKPS